MQPYVPKQQFMKDFDIKYYRTDFREVEENEYTLINRDEVLDNPVRLLPGQTCGPFHGGERNTSILYHEEEDTQVYTYEKSKPIFGFEDKSETLRTTEEENSIQK